MLKLVGVAGLAVAAQAAVLDLLQETVKEQLGAVALATGNKVYQQIVADRDPVEEVEELPFLKGLEDGTATREQVRQFVCEQYSILPNESKNKALLAERFGDSEICSPFFNKLSESDKLATSMLLKLAAAAEYSEEELQGCSPTAKGQAFTAYMAQLATRASRAEAAAAMAVNFTNFDVTFRKMAKTLQKEPFGYSQEDVSFLNFKPDEFPDAAISVIAEGLKKGDRMEEVKRSATLMQAFAKLFWESLGETK